MLYPRAFSHIGLTVTDLDKAVQWYCKVFGLYVLKMPTAVLEDDSPVGVLCADIWLFAGSGAGQRWNQA